MGVCRVTHMPTFVAMEPADFCMLHCPQCPVGMGNDKPHGASKIRQVLDLEKCQQIIDEIEDYAHTVIFHFQGEPLLNNHLPEMIRYAHAHRLYTMLSTNAQLLTPELAKALAEAGLDRIIISMDGLTQETYEHYRVGGKLDRVLAGMRAMATIPYRKHWWEHPQRPEIVLQCLRFRSNEHEWDRFHRDYKALGADRLEMKTAQFYDYENGNADMPSNPRYCRYEQGSDGVYHIKNPLHNHCYRLWSGCVITAVGQMLPCCYDKQHSFSFGTVFSSLSEVGCQTGSVRSAWLSDAAFSFRRRVLRARAHVSMCGNCLE